MDTGTAGVSLGLYTYVSLLQSEHTASPHAADITADLHSYTAKLGESLNANMAKITGDDGDSVSFLNSNLGVYALQCFRLLKQKQPDLGQVKSIIRDKILPA